MKCLVLLVLLLAILIQVIHGFRLEVGNEPQDMYFHQYKYKDVSQNKTALVTSSNSDVNIYNPSDGKLLNRINFKSLSSYKLDQDVLISVDSHNVLRLFDGHTLQEYWNKTLAESSHFQIDFVKDDNHAILVLDDKHLRCFDIISAQLLWETTLQEKYELKALSSGIFLFNSVHILSLDAASGAQVARARLEDYNDLQFTEDYLVLLHGRSKLSVFSLNSLETVASLSKPVKNFVDIDLPSRNIFSVVIKDDLQTYIMSNDKLTQVHSFKYDPASTYVNASLDKNDRAFIVSVSLSNALKALTIIIYTPDGPDGDLENSYTIPYDQAKHGTPSRIISEATLSNNFSSVARIAVTTTSGTMELYQGTQMKWLKEIGLKDPSSIVIVDLPEADETISKSTIDEQTYSFLPRLLSHFHDIKHLPNYLVNFGSRFITGNKVKSSTSLVRDLFGYRKILIVGTKYGKLIGLDSANPDKVLWSRNFGSNTRVTHLLNTRSAGINEAAHVLALVELTNATNETRTLAIEVDSLGGPALTGSGSVAYLPLMEGSPAKVMPLSIECGSSGNRAIAVVDQTMALHLYPSCKTVRSRFESISDVFHFVLQTSETEIGGYTPVISTDSIMASRVWSFAVPQNESILGVQERLNSETASIAQAGPNREAFEKYLNPHAILITASITNTPLKHMYIVDGVTGKADRDFIVEDESEGPNNVFVDNRLIIVTRTVDEKSVVHSKELFLNSDDVQHQYLYSPDEITTMGPTITRNGISYKDIVIANSKNQIVSIPRTYLDPNTPKQMYLNKLAAKNKDKKGNQIDLIIDGELAKIPNDPKAIVNEVPVIGVKDIKCVPSAQLESTSVCVAYGQDIFTFNLSPSRQFDVLSDSFNKIQLAITILALSMGLIIVKPIVKAKKLEMRWF